MSSNWLGGLNYFRSLITALSLLPDRRVAPVLFVGTDAPAEVLKTFGDVEVVRHRLLNAHGFPNLAWRAAGRMPWVQALLLLPLLRRHRIAVFSHGFALPHWTGIKTLGWIPDFQHVHLRSFFTDSELEARQTQFNRLCQRCDALLVSSRAALADLIALAPDAGAKTSVLRFCAIQPNVDPIGASDLVTVYGLDSPYFYLPNQFWAHKNHVVAVRALAQLQTTHPQVKIVCSGSLKDYRNPDHIENLRSEIQRLGLGDRFILLGIIPYSHIAQLMLGAVTVINPSLFEGWSTTVEEAKALGVPLLLSSIPVHREQCECSEASFFAPDEPMALAALMRDKLNHWQGSASRDPRVSLDLHQRRVAEFASCYERIVTELQGAR